MLEKTKAFLKSDYIAPVTELTKGTVKGVKYCVKKVNSVYKDLGVVMTLGFPIIIALANVSFTLSSVGLGLAATPVLALTAYTAAVVLGGATGMVFKGLPGSFKGMKKAVKYHKTLKEASSKSIESQNVNFALRVVSKLSGKGQKILQAFNKEASVEKKEIKQKLKFSPIAQKTLLKKRII